MTSSASTAVAQQSSWFHHGLLSTMGSFVSWTSQDNFEADSTPLHQSSPISSSPLHQSTSTGSTPLHQSTSTGSTLEVQALFLSGADVQARDKVFRSGKAAPIPHSGINLAVQDYPTCTLGVSGFAYTQSPVFPEVHCMGIEWQDMPDNSVWSAALANANTPGSIKGLL